MTPSPASILPDTLQALPELAELLPRMQAHLAASHRPWVTLKAGMSLDGRIATRSGESRWITSEESRAQAHLLRGAHAAVLCGIGTVLADDPALTVRVGAPASQPARVVLDSRARTPLDAQWLRADGARRLLVAGGAAPPVRLHALAAAGVELIQLEGGRPVLPEALRALRGAGVESVLVEGGGQVHGSFIASDQADALFLWVAGMIVGDAAAPAWCAGPALARLADARRLQLRSPRTVGPDVLLHALFQRVAHPEGDAP